MNKYIHPMFLELPTELLSELVRGIMGGDGCEKEGVFRITSVSKELVMSLNLAVMRLYGVVGSVVKTTRHKTTVICGRTVNQKDTYTLQFTKEVRKQKKYHETDDYFLSPIKSVINTGVIDDVYNIEVDTDNSYTVNNAIVHNCQAWSVAGKQLGDKDERGMLFWTTLDIIKKVLLHNPNAKFLMENVKMKKEFEEYITYHTEQSLGYVEKILINSALVSAQNRNRYYWTNFKIDELPKDREIVLKDIIEDGEYEHRPCEIRNNFNTTENGLIHIANATDLNTHESAKRVYHTDGKSPTLNTCGGGNLEAKVLVRTKDINPSVLKNISSGVDEPLVSSSGILQLKCTSGFQDNKIGIYKSPTPRAGNDCTHIKGGDYYYRKVTPLEYERLQTVPDNFTSMLSKTQRYKCLGNGWTIDVIAHILKYAFEK